MELRSVLDKISKALREAEIDHALIGGLALATHGVTRATFDLDLLVDGERDEDVDRISRAMGYECLHRTQHVANYASQDPKLGRVDFLFTRRAHGKGMLSRARPDPAMAGDLPRVVDAADLIGLKVQAYSNDPKRRCQDLADIQRLLQSARELDLERVREYFRIFDREQELEDLLTRIIHEVP